MATKTNHSVASILGINDADISNNVDDPPRHRQRRNRTLFNDSALKTLEESFQLNQYPDINQREQLAETVHVTEARIQVWFQNRRSRLRRNKGTAIPRHEKPAARPNSPLKIISMKSEPLPIFKPHDNQITLPLNYPGYMFGYGVVYPATQYHDLAGFSSSPNSPLWSPTSPNFTKFFDSPVTPTFSTVSTPLKTMFPFPDVVHNRPNNTQVAYTKSDISSINVNLKMAPLDLSDWSGSESRQADVKNSSGSSFETVSINVSTSSDDENGK